jgi:RTX calcium-binding nonapeptide repeat (4 copies)
MEFDERQLPALGRRPLAVLLVGVLALLMLVSAGPAQAKRMLGTKGADKMVGSAKADVIKARGGNDRIKGRAGRDRLLGGRGRDRLLGGRGADRLNAVDGRRDRAVRGGPGRDVCRVDAADRPTMKGCETVKVERRGPPGARTGPGAGLGCPSPPEEARLGAGGPARAAQEEAPPTFSDPFYAITITVNASADGLNGAELPVSIEEVCDVPQPLESEAAQLIGGEGVALISPETRVFDAGGQQLTGDAATAALAGADSVSLRAQLMRPAQWRQDEDGQPVPTFQTNRADITD